MNFSEKNKYFITGCSIFFFLFFVMVALASTMPKTVGETHSTGNPDRFTQSDSYDTITSWMGTPEERELMGIRNELEEMNSLLERIAVALEEQ